MPNITMSDLKRKLRLYPHIRLDGPVHDQCLKLIEHINNGQTTICIREGEDHPYCRTEFAVIEVYHHLSGGYLLKLVEKLSKNQNAHVHNHRPKNGINTKIIRGEKPIQAAGRALLEKLGIADSSGLQAWSVQDNAIHVGTGIPGLYSKSFIQIYHFEMPDDLYTHEGYVFKKKKGGKEIHFEWLPVGSVAAKETCIVP